MAFLDAAGCKLDAVATDETAPMTDPCIMKQEK